ncbi:Sigma-70, region 4 [Enhydrobacter aerosaccus]|uniref:Sigma-70, region 4 n=1 Tax=Enhydrobacter aerosaccus TaxID=225324 RepID=A0A1T4T9T2_9HYPH|nr:response regulator [Enhydrobacter aerosaccus]SKA37039.1 Sigma-70, region 4 [Enhydrobacter aerosaccus]
MSDVPAITKNMSEAITRTLPFLRRYARAVTGSQQRGDEWVRLCAEVAVRQPDLVAKMDDTKLGVFALFHRLQQPFGGLDEATEASTVSSRLKESLTEMAPLQRRMLLLTVLEGFTVADAAHILDIDIDTAERSLQEARRELQRVASVRILVIEDEAVIALDVADIVRNAGHEVVGIAATEKAAVDLARKHSPHLVLADIQLRGADSGISAVREIMRSMSVPVIFVTGYPERLLTGTQVEPAFVISKPFDPDLLRAAIAQALDTVSI